MKHISSGVESDQVNMLLSAAKQAERAALVSFFGSYIKPPNAGKNYPTILQALFERFEKDLSGELIADVIERSEVKFTSSNWAKIKAGELEYSSEKCRVLLIAFYNALCDPKDRIEPPPIRKPYFKVDRWTYGDDVDTTENVKGLEFSRGEKERLDEIGLQDVASLIHWGDVGYKTWSVHIQEVTKLDEDLLEAIYFALKQIGCVPVHVINDNVD